MIFEKVSKSMPPSVQPGHTRGIQEHPMDIDGYQGSKFTPSLCSLKVNPIQIIIQPTAIVQLGWSPGTRKK